MSLAIIHFSDMHISGADDPIFSRIDKIKAACASALPNNGDVVIVISGDIAFSGKKEQYSLAHKMLEEISEYIEEQRSSTVHILCVPGNHDCDFQGEKSTRKTLVDSAKPENIDSEYYNNVVAVQDEYINFARLLGVDASQILPEKEIVVGDNQVLFVLANTAWMSVIDESPGKIIMPHHLFKGVSPDKYKAVFYVYHHPANWLNPDYKSGFIDHIRQNADMILVGHEHSRDYYRKIGESFSVFCNQGKELQDRASEESAFSVLSFDNAFQTYDVIDFVWNSRIYERRPVKNNQYHKNVAATQTVFHPNAKILEHANDIGLTVNHFAKDNVTLPDLFVWPDVNKNDYRNEKNGFKPIRSDIVEELSRNALNIIVGTTSGGKSSFAKMLFLLDEPRETCCLLLNGSSFDSSDEAKIRDAIEACFVEQYCEDCLEDFRQLPKAKRIAIVDDFDLIRLNKNRRSNVLDYLCGFFGRVTIFISSSIELTTILTSNSINPLSELIYYDILPLGNRKRRELISKWYHLSEDNLTEDEINDRVEKSRIQIDTFLGNGAAFIPAMPLFIISTLQNSDAMQQSFNGSKYGFLYESLILSNLSKVSSNYAVSGAYNVDINILAKLAFDILLNGKTSFSETELESTIMESNAQLMLRVSAKDFLKRMIEANIVFLDSSEGDTYRFKYPYIFYYFSGRYIAYHLKDSNVQKALEYMSARLHNETYGNIIIFVCHFANSIEVIETVLLNAYTTLENYVPFDFAKSNPIFDDIQEAVEALIPTSIGNNESVAKNKETILSQMDEIGINDGRVNNGEEVIDDEISESEKDMAAISSALKTIEALGQILQNYPGEICGEVKVDIIAEMHKLGMRAVQAIIKTMGYLEEAIVDYIVVRATNQKKTVRKDDVAKAAKRFINLLISSMARGMIHQVALSLNSEYILSAATKAFEDDSSISSKLILLDLKMNCLNKVDYREIQALRDGFISKNERFASRILDSIVGYYLNYTQCHHSLRTRLCQLCGFSEQETIIANKRNLLN